MRSTSLLPLSLLALLACVPDTAVGNGPKATATTADGAANAPTADASVAIADAGLTPYLDAATPGALVAAPRTKMPEGPPTWRNVPKAQNGFYAVIDGLCSLLDASRVGDDVVVHYGGGNPMYASVRQGAASFIALRADGLDMIGDPRIEFPTGVAGRSGDDFWIADSTGTRSGDGAILHRYFDGKWKTYHKDQTNLHAWLDGGIIGTLGFAQHNGELWVEGSSTKPPDAMTDGLMFPRLAAFPTGEVLVGGPADGGLVVRFWKPDAKVKRLALPAALASSSSVDFVEQAANEVYLVSGDRVARWDGESVYMLAATKGGELVQSVARIGSDDLWVTTTPNGSPEAPAKLQHLTKAQASLVSIPEPIASMSGAERGAAWIAGTSGKLYKREGDTWKNMPLPVPVYSAQTSLKAKEVLVMSADDVLVTAKYWEKAPGWTEQELHTALFRTKPVKETLRCNEPNPENNNVELGSGFQSWPPMATAECHTPFVVLARRTNARKVTDDWPRLRAAVKGHAELGEVTLIEFTSGDRTFVGAKVKSLELGKKLAALAAGKDRLRPEIVCGDPEPKRTLAIDLATGVATVP